MLLVRRGKNAIACRLMEEDVQGLGCKMDDLLKDIKKQKATDKLEYVVDQVLNALEPYIDVFMRQKAIPMNVRLCEKKKCFDIEIQAMADDEVFHLRDTDHDNVECVDPYASTDTVMLNFENMDKMLHFIDYLFYMRQKPESEMYVLKKKKGYTYHVICDLSKLDDRCYDLCLSICGECMVDMELNALRIAYIKEHGQMIMGEHAIDKLHALVR